MKILHLKTQDGQAYGSERRCCEECGVMLWPAAAPIPEGHEWTDDRLVFTSAPEGLPRCQTRGAPTMIKASIATPVNERGQLGTSVIADKEGLIHVMLETIGRFIHAFRVMGGPRHALVFSVPVELHVLMRHTMFSLDRPESLFEIVCRLACLKSEQLVAEYPAVGRARDTIDAIDRMLSQVKQQKAGT